MSAPLDGNDDDDESAVPLVPLLLSRDRLRARFERYDDDELVVEDDDGGKGGNVSKILLLRESFLLLTPMRVDNESDVDVARLLLLLFSSKSYKREER